MKTTFRLAHMPPTTNHLYSTVRRGKGRIRSQEYQHWAELAGWDLKAQRPAKWTVPVYLTIALGKLRKGSDVSNRIKAIEDLLVTHGIIPDDSIAWLRGVNAYLSQVPFEGVEVAITAADPVGVAA